MNLTAIEGTPDEQLTLYEHELSGNSYKVRLFLSLLGLPFEARLAFGGIGA